jgi:signal peptidase II
MKKPLIIIFFILLIDQVIKIYVKTHFVIGEEHRVTSWFSILFTENKGMALGWQLSIKYGKALLSIFRVIAAGFIFWYLKSLVQKSAPFGLIVSISLIFAGAVGNIIDSAFYGIFFTDSGYEVSQFLPHGGGYASFLHGKVVDMFYFPLIEGHFPAWFPLWGNEEFIFFRPVFNFSDACITIGVSLIILFQKKFYPKQSVPVS